MRMPSSPVLLYPLISSVLLACGGQAAPTATAAAAPVASEAAKPSAKAAGSCETGSFDACHAQCDEGVRAACFVLANMYGDGKGVAKDEKRAMDLIVRTCETKPSNREFVVKDTGLVGPESACVVTGQAYADGEGLPKDPTKALSAWQRGCDEGHPVACSSLLTHLLGSDGFHKEPERALTVAPKVCNAVPEHPACLWLAGMLADGDGVKKDAKRSREMFERACAKQSEADCKSSVRDAGISRPK